MMHRDSLKRVTEDGYGPRSSAYLGGGYKEDDFELTNVLIGEKRVLGSVRVGSFFPPSDGEFHLSAPMAMIWICQLGTIYTCYDNVRIPEQSDHRFRRKVITHSGGNRSPIPAQTDQ